MTFVPSRLDLGPNCPGHVTAYLRTPTTSFLHATTLPRPLTSRLHPLVSAFAQHNIPRYLCLDSCFEASGSGTLHSTHTPATTSKPCRNDGTAESRSPRTRCPRRRVRVCWRKNPTRYMDMKGLTGRTVQDKQKRLLSQDAGHFSLVRALHAADYITELNGTFFDIHSDTHLRQLRRERTRTRTNKITRLLRRNVHHVLPPLLHAVRPLQLHKPVLGPRLHPPRSLLRLHGRQSRPLAQEGVAHGPGTRFLGRPRLLRC